MDCTELWSSVHDFDSQGSHTISLVKLCSAQAPLKHSMLLHMLVKRLWCARDHRHHQVAAEVRCIRHKQRQPEGTKPSEGFRQRCQAFAATHHAGNGLLMNLLSSAHDLLHLDLAGLNVGTL